MQRDPNDSRTIKFVGYIYLPKTTGKPITWNQLRTFSMRLGNGRITIFDKVGKPTTASSKTFSNIGEMVSLLAKEFTRRSAKRIPTTAQLRRQK